MRFRPKARRGAAQARWRGGGAIGGVAGEANEVEAMAVSWISLLL